MSSIVDKLAAAVRSRDADAVARCFAPDGVVQVPTSSLEWTGRSGVKDAAATLFDAFGDLRWHPRARWLDQSATVEEGVWTGTQHGWLGDRPPTGQPAEIRARVWVDHTDTEVQRLRIYSDATALKLALGLAVSTLEAAGDTSRLASIGTDRRARVFVRPQERGRPASRREPAEPRRRRDRGRWLRMMAVPFMLAGIVAAALITVAVVRGSPATPGAVATATTSPTPTQPTPTPTPTVTPSATPSTPAPSSGVTRRGRNLDLSTDVLFDRASDKLTPRAMLAISTVADVLRMLEGNGTVRVDGHTDNEGSEAFNLRLSQARADAVATALRKVYKGDLQLRPMGYGESRPVGDNATAKGRAKNRRVTIVLPKQ